MCLKSRYFSRLPFFYCHSSAVCYLSTDELYIVISRYLISYSKDLDPALKNSDISKRKDQKTKNKRVRSSGPLLALLSPHSHLQPALLPSFLQIAPPFTQEFGIHPWFTPHLYLPYPCHLSLQLLSIRMDSAFDQASLVLSRFPQS